ncbi:Non-specific lipid transfer protein GPI-anchored 5 [Linum perenne]
MAAMRTLSILLAVALFFAGATAQSNDCSSTLVSLSPCLNYITGNSSSPSSSCCAQLSTVVKSQPACLCQVINGGGGGLGINVNQTQALALPGACKVQTPPTSQCNRPARRPGLRTRRRAQVADQLDRRRMGHHHRLPPMGTLRS